MTRPDRIARRFGDEVRIVLTTVADAGSGEALVRTLVEERLIACGNLIPGVLSIYRWEGKVAGDEEILVVMKTTAERIEDLFDRVLQLHPYDVPELVELGAGRVAAAYRDWVIASTKGSE
jgi:periplasmic divalent cation tolerance protein